MQCAPTALIAEDEPLLRESLERQLSQAWPELAVVARARNGREAIDQFDHIHPNVCFLDVHMPGVTSAIARIWSSSQRSTSTPCKPLRKACSTIS